MDSSQQVHMINVDQIDPSPNNPRKACDPAELDQLAKSIKKDGLLQPIHLRSKEDGRYEIVYGFRRWNAFKINGDPSIPAFIGHMDDLRTKKVRYLENAQRVGIHPMWEADYLETLAKEEQYTTIGLALELNKPESYIIRRLALTQLVPEVRQAYLEGNIASTVAEQLATISPSEQSEALSGVLLQRSTKEALQFIDGRYRLRLADAKFNKESRTLLPEAGACTTCLKRTGAQPQLFDTHSPDLCTDRQCYNLKQDAHWDGLKKDAAKNHQKVISEKESEKIFSHHYLTTDKYVDLDQKDYQTDKTYREILKDKLTDPPAIARDSSGQIHELVVAKNVQSLIDNHRSEYNKERRRLNPLKPSRTLDPEEKIRRAEAKKKQEFDAEINQRLLAAVSQKAALDTTPKSWRLICKPVLEQASPDALRASCIIRKLTPVEFKPEKGKSVVDAYDTLVEYTEKAKDADCRALVIEVLFHDYDLDEAAKHYDVDQKQIERDLKAEQKKAKIAEIDKAHKEHTKTEKTTNKVAAKAPKSTTKKSTKSVKSDGNGGKRRG